MNFIDHESVILSSNTSKQGIFKEFQYWDKYLKRALFDEKRALCQRLGAAPPEPLTISIKLSAFTHRADPPKSSNFPIFLTI